MHRGGWVLRISVHYYWLKNTWYLQEKNFDLMNENRLLNSQCRIRCNCRRSFYSLSSWIMIIICCPNTWFETYLIHVIKRIIGLLNRNSPVSDTENNTVGRTSLTARIRGYLRYRFFYFWLNVWFTVIYKTIPQDLFLTSKTFYYLIYLRHLRYD